MDNKIDDVLFKIKMKLWSYLKSERDANMAIEPLVWYINTGRAPTPFLKALIDVNNRQLNTIVKKLAKNGGWNTEESVKAIKKYLMKNFD